MCGVQIQFNSIVTTAKHFTFSTCDSLYIYLLLDFILLMYAALILNVLTDQQRPKILSLHLLGLSHTSTHPLFRNDAVVFLSYFHFCFFLFKVTIILIFITFCRCNFPILSFHLFLFFFFFYKNT